MSSPLNFPDKETLRSGLLNSPILNTSYNQANRIDKIVSEMAANRFADTSQLSFGIKRGTEMIVEDLKNGQDSLTKNPVTLDIGTMKTDPRFWTNLSLDIENALLGCAKK